MPKRGCRTPTVYNCLHCEKPECNVCDGVPMDESEIMAMVVAGVLNIRALHRHRTNIQRRKEKNRRDRIDY